jgi:transcriptional regulator with XRE-family HTH domain
MTIGQRVRERRIAHGFSQENLAHAAGLSWGAIQRLEAGKIVDPHYSTLEGIAHTLGTTVAELVGEKEPVPLDKAPDTGSSVDSTEDVITFDDEAVRAAITAAKAGKLTTKEAARAIADSVRGGPVDAVEDAVELLLQHAETSREEVEA